MLSGPSHPFTAPQCVTVFRAVTEISLFTVPLEFVYFCICRWYILDDGIPIYIYMCVWMHTHPPALLLLMFVFWP